ncbi:hypothetical protein D3C79_1060610 [compost metagenome]
MICLALSSRATGQITNAGWMFSGRGLPPLATVACCRRIAVLAALRASSDSLEPAANRLLRDASNNALPSPIFGLSIRMA